MNQTHALENYGTILCKLGLTYEIFILHFGHPNWSMLFTIPGLLLGWTNALALSAIHETLGTNVTNAAIFGNNTCT